MTPSDESAKSYRQRIYTFHPSEQALHSTNRLEIFTDAILAIAATVLVLNLKVATDTRRDGLVHQIYTQRAALVGVLLGFLWISGAWVLSHRSLRQLKGVDHYMTLLVIAGTLNVTLIPFATLLLARGYGRADFWVGVEAVSLVILIGALLSSFGAEYAHRHGLLAATRDRAGNRAAITIWYAVMVLSVAAVVIAPFAPWVALVVVVVTRISALLPLGSDRVGLPGDLRTGATS
jgi:uncharacterized membrane protein